MVTHVCVIYICIRSACRYTANTCGCAPGYSSGHVPAPRMTPSCVASTQLCAHDELGQFCSHISTTHACTDEESEDEDEGGSKDDEEKEEETLKKGHRVEDDTSAATSTAAASAPAASSSMPVAASKPARLWRARFSRR